MKKIVIWLAALAAMLASGLALADATAYSVSGTVSAVTTVGTTRTVRQGDKLRMGETVVTGAFSSAVLRFDDGQIAALGANSRMVIESFEYNAAAKTGNVALRLVRGGMRAITGLVGRNQPARVTYKAGNYTIGIRGTDVTIVIEEGAVVVTVLEGEISFSYGTRTITVRAGEGVNARADGTFQSGAIDTIMRQLQSTPEGQRLLDSLGGMSALADAIRRAASGEPGGPDDRLLPTPGPTGPGSMGGGGTASSR